MRSLVLFAVRYVLPVALFLTGIVFLVVARGTARIEAAAGFFGTSLSVFAYNVFFRLSVSGDRERDEEEDARRFLDEHGYWPDEAPASPAEPRPDAEPQTDPHSAPHRRGYAPGHR